LEQNLGSGLTDDQAILRFAGPWAGSFTTVTGYTLSRVSLPFKISLGTGAFTQDVTCKIYDTAAGHPNALLGTATATISPDLTSSYVYYDFDFAGIAIICHN